MSRPDPKGNLQAELRPLLLTGEQLAQERERATTLPQVAMDSRETSDLIMLGNSAFTPLPGFVP